jgi:hypothetical protein
MKKTKTGKKNPIIKVIIPITFVLIFTFLFTYLFLLPKRPSFSRLKNGKELNYILITVDTLRADRIPEKWQRVELHLDYCRYSSG